MKHLIVTLLTLLLTAQFAQAQSTDKKPYDETIDPMVQIDAAIQQAKDSGRNVICQVGGNWCVWCLRLAQFVEADTTLHQFIDDNFVYIHVNYPSRRNPSAVDSDALKQRLGNAGRFGFPVLVVLDGDGQLKHIQDSSFLEEGNSYSSEKIMRFLKEWTPEAITTLK